jgi:hypothetical protein
MNRKEPPAGGAGAGDAAALRHEGRPRVPQGGPPRAAAGGAALSASAVGAGAFKARGRHPARRRLLAGHSARDRLRQRLAGAGRHVETG